MILENFSWNSQACFFVIGRVFSLVLLYYVADWTTYQLDAEHRSQVPTRRASFGEYFYKLSYTTFLKTLVDECHTFFLPMEIHNPYERKILEPNLPPVSLAHNIPRSTISRPLCLERSCRFSVRVVTWYRKTVSPALCTRLPRLCPSACRP